MTNKHSMSLHKTTQLLAVVVLLFCVSPSALLASDSTFTFSSKKAVVIGETFTVSAFLNTTTAANALEGSVNYPSKMLAVTSLSTANSIISYWQSKPSQAQNSGVISFTGGLPTPGFTGRQGQLFSISFKALAEGTATISYAENTKALANDGLGSVIPHQYTPITINIGKPTEKAVETPLANTPDNTPPIHLELAIGKDETLFSGNWFAAFQAEDVESGIQYYEIAEIDAKKEYPTETDWVRTRSPYQLKNQGDKDIKVFLKAVDMSGNETVISKIAKGNRQNQPTLVWLSLISVVLLLFVIILGKRLLYKQEEK